MICKRQYIKFFFIFIFIGGNYLSSTQVQLISAHKKSNGILLRIVTNAIVNIYNWDRKTILSHEKMRHTNFLHRIPESISELRVVEIEDIDLCPCGGTHVDSIGRLDNLKIINVKSKGAGKLRISY